MDKIVTNLILIEEGSGVELTFHENSLYKVLCPDFIESYLSGNLNQAQKEIFQNKNFLKSKIHKLKMSGLNFAGCDFLDSVVDTCVFDHCDLTFQHFTSCTLTKTQFIHCDLTETNHQSSTFENCKFIDCNFLNILMKTCTFVNCKFINCRTSNKLFESCLLIDCSFKQTPLQIQTISENFGLRAKEFDPTTSLFRDKRQREEFKQYRLEELEKKLLVDKGVISSFSYSYFSSEMGSETLTLLFQLIENPSSWFDNGTSLSALTKLEALTTLLIHLYNNDKLILLPLIKLSDVVSNSITYVDQLETLESRSYSRTLHGIKYDLSKPIAVFLKKLNELVSFFNSNKIVLEAIGPLDKKYYQRYFDNLSDSDLEIIAVTPKNSPNFLKIAVKSSAIWAFISLILTTQYKYQVENINVSDLTTSGVVETLDPKEAAPLKLPSHSLDLKSYSLSLGPLDTKDKDIGFQMVSVFSNGMTEKLQLTISPKRAIELQKLIIGFIGSE